MANFGFPRLAVVAPYAEHWREARSAVGAPDVLQDAKSAEHLAEAVAECTLVIGTGTLEHRKPEQPVVPLPELAPLVDAELARGGRMALVFGPEKHGLTREDLALCHVLVEIPTDPRQPSMNLGQAVAVCLYELAAASTIAITPSRRDRVRRSPARPRTCDPAAASHAAISICSQRSSQRPCGPQTTRPRRCGRRTARSATCCCAGWPRRGADARRILGLFRRILWRSGTKSPQGLNWE